MICIEGQHPVTRHILPMFENKELMLIMSHTRSAIFVLAFHKRIFVTAVSGSIIAHILRFVPIDRQSIYSLDKDMRIGLNFDLPAILDFRRARRRLFKLPPLGMIVIFVSLSGRIVSH